jgi:divalent metal cation (Fe/Co/Zn/Cd) transporter
MPLLGGAKARIGSELDSGATIGAGRQNILCAYLSAAVLVGLAANLLLRLWWADPVVALVVAAACLQAGRSTWRGDRCDPK